MMSIVPGTDLEAPGALADDLRLVLLDLTKAPTTFATRAAFIAADLSSLDDGVVAFDGTVSYKKLTGATAIADKLGWVPHGDECPEHFGDIASDLADCADAMEACLAYAGRMFLKARTYRISRAVTHTGSASSDVYDDALIAGKGSAVTTIYVTDNDEGGLVIQRNSGGHVTNRWLRLNISGFTIQYVGATRTNTGRGLMGTSWLQGKLSDVRIEGANYAAMFDTCGQYELDRLFISGGGFNSTNGLRTEGVRYKGCFGMEVRIEATLGTSVTHMQIFDSCDGMYFNGGHSNWCTHHILVEPLSATLATTLLFDNFYFDGNDSPTSIIKFNNGIAGAAVSAIHFRGCYMRSMKRVVNMDDLSTLYNSLGSITFSNNHMYPVPGTAPLADVTPAKSILQRFMWTNNIIQYGGGTVVAYPALKIGGSRVVSSNNLYEGDFRTATGVVEVAADAVFATTVNETFLSQRTAGTNIVTNSNPTLVSFGHQPAEGVMDMPGLPTYADNAAAVSGGLAVGKFYKTATGEMRIVV